MQETIIIDGKSRINPLDLKELWAYRDLIVFLTQRQITVQYKQTILGFGWVILQPIASLIIFSIVFGVILEIPSGDIPYPIFVFSGLLPWRYFTAALSGSTASLVSNTALISKVYFPRQVLLIVAMLVPLVNFGFSFVTLLLLMAGYGYNPFTWNILLLPFFMFLAMLTALAIGLWLSALNVVYRDFRQLTGFLIQFWMFLTPVIYPAFEVPENLRTIYNLNPMVGIVEGSRWVLLGSARPDFQTIGISTIIVLIIFGGGLIFFSYLERIFGEII